MIKYGLPRAMPKGTMTRLVITQFSPITATRSIHVSHIRPVDLKASYATVAPEQKTPSASPPPTPTPPTSSPEDHAVVRVDPKSMAKSVVEKRDFHWNHPVYTREEYEKIQVTISPNHD